MSFPGPSSAPRITFGIIVLNGEPFTRYNLRTLYPFAHQIIAVEGASLHAAPVATPDGHSHDGTLDVLRRFKAEEDPEGKLLIVTAEDEGHPNGFWPGEKDEQSQAYAKRSTGDYLWQIDIDEFYRPADIATLLTMLREQPATTQVTVRWTCFWGSIDYVEDGAFLRQFYEEQGGGVPRIFKWGPGYRYVTHRPPTVVDPAGHDLRNIQWIRGDQLAEEGICCYHYCSLLPRQVREKAGYYGRVFPKVYGWMPRWAEENYMQLGNPFWVHESPPLRRRPGVPPSWLERFRGEHPPEILKMMADIRSGKLPVELRPTDDIERLLRSPRYRIARTILKAWVPVRYGQRWAPLRRLLRIPP